MKKLLPLLLCLSNIAFAQDTLSKDVGGLKTISSTTWLTLDEPGYTITYPDDWELNQSGQGGTSFALLSPIESESDTFRENINLIMQDLSGHDIDLDQYTEISEGQIKTMMTNATTMESKRITTPAGEYHRLVYSADQGVYRLVFEQFYWVDKRQAFVLTFTSEAARFPSYQAEAEKIMNTFVPKFE